jgi:DNA-binding transcriptional ArsR family regulator
MASVLDLAGRWRRGLDGSYVYLARAENGAIKVGATTDPLARLNALNAASPVAVEMVRLLPGGQAHRSYLHRRFDEWRQPGDWFAGDAAVEVEAFARSLQEAVQRSEAHDPRQAMVDAIRTVDQDLAALERLWLNGATYQQITDISGLAQPRVRRWLEAMRAMGFVLPHRYQFTSRDRNAYSESGIIVARRRRAA